MNPLEWSEWARDGVAWALGFGTAIFNVAAGGGSMLTIPLLVEFGLTAQQANATNRIGVLLQAAASSTTFARGGHLPWRWFAWLTPVCWVGALGGAWLSTVLPDDAFRLVVGVIFALLGVYLLVDRVRRLGRADREGGRWMMAVDFDERPPLVYHIAFLGVGLYGGFIQGGVGILILTVLHVIGRASILRSNALKTALIVGFTLPAMWVFVQDDLIRWREGAALAAGGVMGGWVGARVAARIPAGLLENLLLVGVFLAAARFLGLI